MPAGRLSKGDFMKLKKICICTAITAMMAASAVACGDAGNGSVESYTSGQNEIMPGNAYMKSVMDIMKKVAPDEEIELITGSGGAGDILDFNVKTKDGRVYIVGIAPDDSPVYVKDGETKEYLWTD